DMNGGALVPGEADKAHLARLPGGNRRFHPAARRKDALRVGHADDFVELDQIDSIGLKKRQRFVDLARGGLAGAAVGPRRSDNFVAVAAAQRLAHPLLARAAAVIPAVIHEVDAVIDRGANNADALGFAREAEMSAADAHERHLLPGAS